ncbi:phage tail protein [Candidatus Pantoea deserta]|uniref:Phage tail protein n=1 Tax=Candidatus Pantoea deserta TaxID=1869313 RepID=A0A3N4NYB6_9GAMM|nr:phage tail protein [Pantoea deserta]RPD99208.1 phage tail protein [Pantoea deserta]
MMMIYGMLPFMRQTLPYNKLEHSSGWKWASSNRVGRRAAVQFTGKDSENITLSGELRPEITGGPLKVLAFQLLADEGRAWPLIGGDGTIYGMYVINKFTTTHTDFYADGSARMIAFNLSLLRVDESLVSMFGDLAAQGDALWAKAKTVAGNVASGINSAISTAGGLSQ